MLQYYHFFMKTLIRATLFLSISNVQHDVLSAQQSKISVTSFNCMETEITTRVTAPKKDQNGEIWIYVPRGTRRISILHDEQQH